MGFNSAFKGLILVCDHILTSLNLVLIQVAESKVWLPNFTYIANGLFIC